MARAKVPRATFDYIAGGAEDEVTLRRNREAFGRWALRPRVLTDVSKRDTKTVLLGERVSMPVCVAPTSFHALVHPEGEVATARGAAAAETILIASTISTKPLEEVAAAADAPRWFQLYVYRDRAVTEDLVARAVKAGYKALCLQADPPVLGRRERDERNAFTLPPGFGIANLKGAGLDGMPAVEHGSAFAKYVTDLLDSSVTWDDVEWLKSISPLPLVIKGIMTPEDAVLAVDHGAAGIVVSNHGGRQLDSTLGSLDALADRKSTRLNSSHSQISYAVFCLKKKNNSFPHILARIAVHHHSQLEILTHLEWTGYALEIFSEHLSQCYSSPHTYVLLHERLVLR